MRLICPNCEAQYEVDERVIPDEGRDVQCSSCGRAWFQPSAATLAAEAARAEVEMAQAPAEAEAPVESAPVDVAEAEVVAAADDPQDEYEEEYEQEAFEDSEAHLNGFDTTDEDAAELEAAEEADIPAETDVAEVETIEVEEAEIVAAEEVAEASEDTDAPVPDEPEVAVEAVAEDADSDADEEIEGLAAAPMPQRRGLDNAVLDVLREEAEIESRARQDEGLSVLEDQPDLGLVDAEEEAPITDDVDLGELDSNISELLAEEAEIANRSDLLPDIEEINSSLRATTDRGEAGADNDEFVPEMVRGRSGFRLGFFLMLLLISGGVIIYASAPRLIALWPAGEAPLSAYVQTVNSARISLDASMASAVDMISAFLEGT